MIDGKNVIERIQNSIATDDSGDDGEAQRIANYYLDATEDAQRVVDRIFIALCGWSLRTLLDNEEDSSYNPFQGYNF